jgi:hypothetical protein
LAFGLVLPAGDFPMRIALSAIHFLLHPSAAANVSCRWTAACVCLLLSIVASAEGQTQDSCAFNVFQLDTSTSNSSTSLGGINDFSTVVGSRFLGGGNVRGLIRFSGGGITYYSAPNGGDTRFTDRNKYGISTGYYFNLNSGRFDGFVLDGSHFTSISRFHAPTFLFGINKWNSTVGAYASGSYPRFGGFKRYSNGGFVGINYPGALGTSPSGINDQGTIVGTYFLSSSNDPFYSQHGFIYHNGSWATLDYPDSTLGTSLVGLSNDNVIIGNTISSGQTIQSAFLYKNGKFKTVSAPKEPFTEVTGISPKLGMISGMALDFSGSTEGFIATCN